MMGRYQKFAVLLGAAVAAAGTVAVARHSHGGAAGRRVPGGILVGDAVAYDNVVGRLVLGSPSGPSPPMWRRWPRQVPRTACGCSRWDAGRAACRSGWPAGMV